ncbi:hypothetical protein EUGRSUZ_E03356 [Eucalyptus grandis]|uniref:Uncharacterized protein n=2 Tax=Eucalyptus grandis TaxID=71139 RepID=A0ACC3KZT2_EUCGR|nr:hypothetical protein EUGRSUZ_E03356 [Eucalyptus grandis]
MTPLEPAPFKISGAELTKKSPPPPPPLPAAKEAPPSPPNPEPPVPENVATQGAVDSEPAAHTIAVVTIKAPPPAAPSLPPPKLPPIELAAGELPPLPTVPKIPRTAQIAASPPLPPAPPPLPAPSKGSIPSPSPQPLVIKGAPPPPPPSLGATKSLYPKKAMTKLRRSTQIASLYRFLKGKIEGSNLEIKHNSGKNRQVGGSASGKQGKAEYIEEMKKRSAYYQKIEKDMQTHGKTIMDLKAKINSFQTKDMVELIKFRNFIESHLENLTDETQVLARFEDFPTKKLEALRAAAALRLKLEAIVVDLQNWKIAPPLGKLFDQIENYFNKVISNCFCSFLVNKTF